MTKLFLEFIDILVILWIRWWVQRAQIQEQALEGAIANAIADNLDDGLKKAGKDNGMISIIPEFRGKHYHRKPIVINVRWADGKSPEEILYKQATGISEV